ncbi:6-phosphogluconolactonase [Nocardioides sp. SOB77]|uniref:6-phosphogluconolactonase n=1 Tax=Nocardioides oceani TaxID=3058369 RepID=A0ABT8FJV3_9ACTN|nr:6-phosphogluconolactonase [Nocardioides oceani]MDN4174805.1 6-phosphogluconolactonase [Nocardioides oceani]
MTTPPHASPRIEVHEDDRALATAVAGELLTRLADAQAAGRVPQIALTGGTIAEVVHREIARLAPGSEVDWTRVVVWWGDERYVEPGSPDRNAGQAREAFLSVVGVPDENVHEVPTTADCASVEEAAAAYAETLRTHGASELEVVMLGLGPDAHVASLFPGHPALDVRGTTTVAVHDSPKPPPERVSLTFEALNANRALWFLVSGEGKAEAVARALAGRTGAGEDVADVHDVPAAGVSGGEETIWFLDRASASRL